MKIRIQILFLLLAVLAGLQKISAQGVTITNTPDIDGPNLPADKGNDASFEGATAAGGEGNAAEAFGATVGGGFNNFANGRYATIGGGDRNWATGRAASVAGGEFNQATGHGATVPGGSNNVAAGDFSFAAGKDAQATDDHAFVWSDGSAPTSSSGAHQFVARAGGGIYFYSATNGTGVILSAGSGSWSTVSDRNAKKDFATVNSRALLDQVASLPLATWSYKTEPGVRHVGPTAQDFRAAFGVGEDDRHIAEVDANGVALAAIQGLNQKLKENNAEIQALKATVEQLQQTLRRLAPPPSRQGGTIAP